MGTNDHARDRVNNDHTTPPSGSDRHTDRSHALRAGPGHTSQRKSGHSPKSPRRATKVATITAAAATATAVEATQVRPPAMPGGRRIKSPR